MPLWTSPCFVCRHNHSQSDCEEAVTLEDGWYALFFGMDECVDDDTQDRYDPQATLFIAHDEFATRKLALPFSLDNVSLRSLQFGIAIFLKRGSRLRVILDGGFDCAKGAISTDNVISERQWQLYKLKISITSTERDEHLPSHGEVKTHRLVCRTCGKSSFRDIQSIRQHCQNVHKMATSMASTSNIMWKEPLTVLYQDDFIAVIVKPQNMAVMGGTETLMRSPLLLPLKSQALAAPIWPNNDDGDKVLNKPRITHRLDAGTGGVLVVAKTQRSEMLMKKAFADRTCHKTYVALCWGRHDTPLNGVIDEPISGKESHTDYHVMDHVPSISSPDGWLTLLQLHPVTGRRHQLRRHLKHIGHPIYGDRCYGPPQQPVPDVDHYSRLCLWAVEISFPHPFTKGMTTCRMDYPPDWLRYVLDQEGSSSSGTKAVSLDTYHLPNLSPK